MSSLDNGFHTLSLELSGSSAFILALFGGPDVACVFPPLVDVEMPSRVGFGTLVDVGFPSRTGFGIPGLENGLVTILDLVPIGLARLIVSTVRFLELLPSSARRIESSRNTPGTHSSK